MPFRFQFFLIALLTIHTVGASELGNIKCLLDEGSFDNTAVYPVMAIADLNRRYAVRDFISVRQFDGSMVAGEVVSLPHSPTDPLVLRDPDSGATYRLPLNRLDVTGIHRGRSHPTLLAFTPEDLLTLFPFGPTAPDGQPRTGHVEGFDREGNILFRPEGSTQTETLPRHWFDFDQVPPIYRLPPETMTALTAELKLEPVRGIHKPDVTELTAGMSQYFPRGDGHFWAKYMDTGVRYEKGQTEGASQIQLDDGTPAVVKTYRIFTTDQANQTLALMRIQEGWINEGRGPRILGAGMTELPSGERRLTVVMEDVLAPHNQYGDLVVGGDMEQMDRLKPYSQQMREWLRDRALQQLGQNDRKLENGLFRVFRLRPGAPLPRGAYYREGDLIAQVILIDPKLGTVDLPTHLSPELDPVWQRNTMNRAMGLTEPHPATPEVNVTPLRDALGSFMPPGRTNYWTTTFDASPKTEIPKGNQEGAHRLTLPDGTHAVGKVYEATTDAMAHAIVDDLNVQRAWTEQGRGVPILGVGVSHFEGGTGRVTVIMEDYLAPTNSVGHLVVGGDGEEAGRLRNYSDRLKTWVRNTALSYLAEHNDGYLPNIMFRVSEYREGAPLPPKGTFYQEGNLIVQLALIDPLAAPRVSHETRTGDYRRMPEPMWKYNQNWQREQLNEMLGLPN